jgi:hypothetical protein
LEAPVWETGQSGFLGTETVNNTNKFPIEFNNNLELLKDANKIWHINSLELTQTNYEI